MEINTAQTFDSLFKKLTKEVQVKAQKNKPFY
jgi:hypothetical protein